MNPSVLCALLALATIVASASLIVMAAFGAATRALGVGAVVAVALAAATVVLRLIAAS